MLAQALLPKYKCQTCGPELKRERGCDSKPRYPISLDGEDLQRCPLRPYLDDPGAHNELMALYGWYRRGLLPDPGTMLDQSASLVEAFLVVDAAVRDAERERAERDKQSRKRAAGGPKHPPALKPKGSARGAKRSAKR